MKKMKDLNKRVSSNRGITMIALVITIIVLLILAGITIGNLTSDKGVIKEAKTAKEKTEMKGVEEQIEMAIVKAEQKYNDPTLDNVIEELKNNKVISNASQVDKVTGAVTSDLGYVIEGKLNDYIGYAYLFNFDKTTGTILGMKREHMLDYYVSPYSDRSNFNYFGSDNTNDITYYGYGGCTMDQTIDTLVVPSEIDGVKVKTVCYIGAMNVRRLIFEEGIETIQKAYSILDITEMEDEVQFLDLEEVVIPSTVKEIGKNAFSGCKGLKSVYFKQTTAPTFGVSCFYKESGNRTTFYFKNSTVANSFTQYNSSYGTKSTNYNW